MMITICSKFGTGDGGATVGSGTVGIAEGMIVGSSGTGANVGERIGVGLPGGTIVGGALVVQEANKIDTKIHRPKRFM
jgi:hypothetical protein